jgi:hypothetical protein
MRHFPAAETGIEGWVKASAVPAALPTAPASGCAELAVAKEACFSP